MTIVKESNQDARIGKVIHRSVFNTNIEKKQTLIN